MVEMKLVVVIIILRMLVIMKNRIICTMNIVTIKRSKMVDHDRVHDMITDAFSETTTTITDEDRNVE